MKEILKVAQLTKEYKRNLAVNNVSFAVCPNEIVGLLGPNGAGKTTIINMILGVLTPSAGTIEIHGKDLEFSRQAALAKTNFAAVYSPLPGNLTVRQNLRIFGMIYGVKNLSSRIETLLQQYELERFQHTKCGLLSSGEQTRVAMAKAMLNSPDLLLLDEPTASLDPVTARDVRQSIKKFVKGSEAGVLWTSHNMFEVEEVCDRVLFLFKGSILMEGPPRKLLEVHHKSSLEDLFVSVAREPLGMEL